MTGLPFVVRWRNAILASDRCRRRRASSGTCSPSTPTPTGGSCYPSMRATRRETGYAELDGARRDRVARPCRVRGCEAHGAGGRVAGGLGVRNTYRLQEPPAAEGLAALGVVERTPRQPSEPPGSRRRSPREPAPEVAQLPAELPAQRKPLLAERRARARSMPRSRCSTPRTRGMSAVARRTRRTCGRSDVRAPRSSSPAPCACATIRAASRDTRRTRRRG